MPPSLAAACEGLRRVLMDFGNESRPSVPRSLTEAELQLIGPIYNRVIYRPPEDATLPALNPGPRHGRDRAALPRRRPVDCRRRRFARRAGAPRPCSASAGRRRSGFDCKEYGGYLGAYLHEGFDHPVLIALACELQARLGGIVAGHRLTQMWGLQLRPGGRRHAQARGQGRRQRQPLDHAGRGLPRARGGRPHRPRCRRADRLGLLGLQSRPGAAGAPRRTRGAGAGARALPLQPGGDLRFEPHPRKRWASPSAAAIPTGGSTSRSSSASGRRTREGADGCLATG